MSTARKEHDWPEVLKCPYEFYDDLRSDSPVYKLPGRNEYLISRYDDVVWAARHPELFSSKRVRPADEDPDVAAIAAEGFPTPPTVVDNDPPDHTKYRAVGFQAFVPKRLAAYEPRIRQITNELIDRFIDRGNADFVAEFAGELPMAVMVDILDLPRDTTAQLKRWVDEWTELIQKFTPKQRTLELQRSVVEFEKFLAHHIEQRRSKPRDDVLSEFVHSQIDPSVPLELPHLLSITKIFVTAGTETTANLIANSMWLLLQREDLLHRVAADWSLIPHVLEESLRNESPAQWSQRRCLVDTEVAGTVIPAGARVLLMWAAGNRDGSQFADPERFDLDRSNAKRHLGFGTGPHSCIGAPLARLEGRIAFEEFFRRTRNVRFKSPDQEPSWVVSSVLRGLGELQLAFEPAASGV